MAYLEEHDIKTFKNFRKKEDVRKKEMQSQQMLQELR